MLAIETINLSKLYGENRGIRNVNLKVERGEVYGFIGPNGAGKSTTIRTLLGLIHPSGGRATILGHDIVSEGVELRKKIGYLPSEVHYYDEMNSRELLEYSIGFYDNINPDEIEHLADFFELDLAKNIADLSFGNKKKCAIIQAVLHRPELLILDEPTSGLDPLMQNRFFDLLEEKHKEGTTIFFSSHILSEIQRMCDRAAVIRDGEISAIENIQDLLKKQMKKVRIVFNPDAINRNLPIGSQNEKWHDQKVNFEYVGPIESLIQWMNESKVVDVVMEEPDLETIFMNYYKR